MHYPLPPSLDFVFEARIEVATPVELGLVSGVRKRIIPITGGTVSGERLNGTILSMGADWQEVSEKGVATILARYAIRSDDGCIAAITNPGIRSAPPEITAKLIAGEHVDPEQYYFRTTPTFETASDGPLAWLMESVFVCIGIRQPTAVLLDFFAVR